MQLVIGNKNYSSWSLRPWLLLTYHRLPFEEVRIALDVPETGERIAAFSDAGKVPVLRDGGLTVWDSLAICEYVSERYLNGKGWPEALQTRAHARSVSAEMHSGFSEVRNRLPMNCRATGRHVDIPEPLRREIERIDRIWSGCLQRYAASGPWLFGDFSIADCMFAPVVFRFRTYGIAVSEISANYMSQILALDAIRDWEHSAQAEPEVLASGEVGGHQG